MRSMAARTMSGWFRISSDADGAPQAVADEVKGRAGHPLDEQGIPGFHDGLLEGGVLFGHLHDDSAGLAHDGHGLLELGVGKLRQQLEGAHAEKAGEVEAREGGGALHHLGEDFAGKIAGHVLQERRVVVLAHIGLFHVLVDGHVGADGALLARPLEDFQAHQVEGGAVPGEVYAAPHADVRVEVLHELHLRLGRHVEVVQGLGHGVARVGHAEGLVDGREGHPVRLPARQGRVQPPVFLLKLFLSAHRSVLLSDIWILK